MSRQEMQHPEGGTLMAFVDGELSTRQTAEVRRHLEACWQCRAELEELQATVADCVRYRKEVVGTILPPPPAPWRDLSRDFAAIDASLAAEARAARWKSILQFPAPLRWAGVAAAILVTASVLFYQLRLTPSVQAAALLDRAVAAANAKPTAVKKLRIRTRDAQFTKMVGRETPAADLQAAVPVAALFESARYTWTDPLSASAYREWRKDLKNPTDEVSNVPEGYRISTSSTDSELAVASLTLRAADLEPVAGRFEFRNHEWVEVSEFADASTSDAQFSAANNVEAPPRRVVPSQPVAPSSGSSVSVSEELRVLAALHEIGADLGDPVEVNRESNRVLVSGVGVPARRQEEIRRALNGMPGVAVEFGEATAAAVPDSAPVTAPRGPERPGRPALQSRLEQILGGRADLERFTGQMLEWSESAQARVFALRSLAQRYPASVEAGLSSSDRQVLIDLASSHIKGLNQQYSAMQKVLSPVLTGLGASAAARTAVEAPTWQAASEELYRASLRADRLLSSLLGVAAVESNPARVPTDLMGAMQDLASSAGRCAQLLTR